VSVPDHVEAPLDRLSPPQSDPRSGDRPVTDRPVTDRPGHDPLASFAFWGREGAAGRRPAGVSWFDRIRGDARLGVAALLVCALVAGLVWYRVGVGGAGATSVSGAARTASDATPSSTSASASTTRPAAAGASAAAGTRAKGTSVELVVHVAGAVVRPGIVRLRAGARVVDAIEAAGGARPEADLDQLNLAAKVADGQRIAVGLPGQPATALASPGGATSAVGGADGSTTGPLDLNTATQTEIESLPGIGPVLGAAILRERDERGGFRSVDELRSVRGIGEKRFEDLRDLVTV